MTGMILDRIRALRAGERVPFRVLVVAAHPDDETIGAAGLMMRAGDVHVVHMTDGAPRDSKLWTAQCDSSEAYAAIRRDELLHAMRIANVAEDRLRSIGVRDQALVANMVEASRALVRIVREVRPEAIVTMPYEGGHPDHDATSFATRAVARLLRDAAPPLLEMTAYHARNGEIFPGGFLGEGEEAVLELSDDERERKRAMFGAFATQVSTLQYFGADREKFRVAPAYDYSKPPHDGALFYELQGWASGAQWRASAASAGRYLALEMRCAS